LTAQCHRLLQFFTFIVRLNTVKNVHTKLAVQKNRECKTRQLSYRKEDRAMRPIYGCPEKY